MSVGQPLETFEASDPLVDFKQNYLTHCFAVCQFFLQMCVNPTQLIEKALSVLSSRILSGWGDTMLSGRGPLLKKLFTPITAIPFVSCQHLAVRLPTMWYRANQINRA